MVITYNKTYREDCQGADWKLYSDVNFKDSLIIYELFKFTKNRKAASFNELFQLLKNRYKNKTVRSRCVIERDDKHINIFVKGVFPRFYIEKV